MAVGDAHVFPGFHTPVLTQLFFLKPPIAFLTCFSRDETRKYAGKKVRFNQVSNTQPPGHESDKLTTEPPGRAVNTDPGVFCRVAIVEFTSIEKLDGNFNSHGLMTGTEKCLLLNWKNFSL